MQNTFTRMSNWWFWMLAISAWSTFVSPHDHLFLSSPLVSSLCTSSPPLFNPSRPFCLLLFSSPLSSSTLSQSLVYSLLCCSFPLWKPASSGAKNSIAHFVSLSASIYAPLLPSFLFILILSLLFHLLSPSDNRFRDLSIEITHLHCLPLSGLSPLEFCPAFTVQKKRGRLWREGKKTRRETFAPHTHTHTGSKKGFNMKSLSLIFTLWKIKLQWNKFNLNIQVQLGHMNSYKWVSSCSGCYI